MLGRLARYLRAAGYDVVYNSRIEDRDLIGQARAQQRIILTRDRQIACRRVCKQGQPACIILESLDYRKQLSQLRHQLKIKLAVKFKRCLECNSILDEVDKKDFVAQIPPYVYQNQHQFKYCPHCRKIYWNGSHMDSIRKVLAMV